MNKLALFDCDGTLVDSQANICAAMEAAFGLHGLIAPERSAIRRIVGLSLVEAVRGLLPQADDTRHHAIAEDYKQAFQRLRATGSLNDEPLFEGLIDMLDVLQADGWVLGVATGKSDRGLNHVLSAHGIAHRFVTLQTADRHPSKPHPSMIAQAMAEAGATPGSTVMIGDTSYDMIMARTAGTRALGVAWGYHPPVELYASGAHAVAERMPDVPGLMLA